MERFAEQLDALVAGPDRSIDSVAKDLSVCRAALYNCRNKKALPSFEVLKSSHHLFGFKFPYIEFDDEHIQEPRKENQPGEQGVFPFFRAISPEDISVIGAKPIERENALELTVQIRFAS
ncbi:MAG: hypothetical protein ABSF23_14690 [Terracidiphilus sp.]